MIHDLFSLKIKLNVRHLTTEMDTHTFTVRADRVVGGRVQQLCKVFPLEELLRFSDSPVEAIFLQMVDRLEWSDLVPAA